MIIDLLCLDRIGEGACFGLVHSQLFAAQDNIKRSGGQHITWLASWFRPEWIVTPIAHVGFRLLYPSACVLTLWCLHFVGCSLWLESTRICRLRWLQVAGCYPWLEASCVPGARWLLFSNSYPWPESICVPGRRQASSPTTSCTLPWFLARWRRHSFCCCLQYWRKGGHCSGGTSSKRLRQRNLLEFFQLSLLLFFWQC